MSYRLKEAPSWARLLMLPMDADFLAWPPDVVYFKAGIHPNDRMIRHECKHLEQYKRDGYLTYCRRWWGQYFTVGYDKIDYEIEAREAENG